MSNPSRSATHTLPFETAFMLVLILIALGLHPAPVAYAQNRMPPIPESEMTDAQRELAEWYRGERDGARLAGPWVPLSRSPEVARLMIDMRSHVANRSLLNPQLTEIPILIAAREWSQQFEWNAHARIAERAGLNTEIIAAIAEGRRPGEMSEEEEILYDFCMELQRSKSVSDATYDRTLAAFGQDRIIEAVALQGYYALLAMVMNTARTPLPEGTVPPLPMLPR